MTDDIHNGMLPSPGRLSNASGQRRATWLTLGADLVFDAIRMRLVEIGEAVKELDDETRSLAPELPWAEIARMRDMLAHRYFDTTHAIVMATARDDVPRLAEAVRRMLGRPNLTAEP